MTTTNRDLGDETSYVECSRCLEETFIPYFIMPDGSIICSICYRRGPGRFKSKDSEPYNPNIGKYES
jgi:hypothetical protein